MNLKEAIDYLKPVAAATPMTNYRKALNTVMEAARETEEKKVQVKIKLLPGGKMPEKKSAGAAAFDCYASENVVVEGKPALIGLGFALEIPEGYHAKIFPRSSIGLKTNLRQPNCCGIIDSDYRGEVKAIYFRKLVPSYGIVDCEIKLQCIKKGDRIAQMLIERNEDVELVAADELSETDRGSGGFGSTGRA